MSYNHISKGGSDDGGSGLKLLISTKFTGKSPLAARNSLSSLPALISSVRGYELTALFGANCELLGSFSSSEQFCQRTTATSGKSGVMMSAATRAPTRTTYSLTCEVS